jgi:UDP-N-acetylglucosamine--N-acetylmuramyl-(pentapeptide) pyrophosphoryl-undecaprenol N-acetylglucosamine transferase
MTTKPVILFAGGGTGGHIFPNLAVVERLREKGVEVQPHFIVSDRLLDAEILKKHGVEGTALCVRTLPRNVMKLPGFVMAWRKANAQMREVIHRMKPAAMIATGGFVSGPAIVTAEKMNVPNALVNLDAVPGKANLRLRPLATSLFSVYAHPSFAGAEVIGLPMRRAALGPEDPREARAALGLEPDRPTLMITGGSQGARSVNEAVIELLSHATVREAFDDWQVLHIAGPNNDEPIRKAYASMNVRAIVLPFCDKMGCAWRSADIAVCRGGAGSVAEAWANTAPSIIFPYPGHADEHQRLNAQPMADAGGAVIVKDTRDASAAAAAVHDTVLQWLTDAALRRSMRDKLKSSRPPDGADALAEWLTDRI